MSRKYKFYNPKGLYLVSFATVNWIDVFTRRIYIDIVVDSLNYCIKEKGLVVYAWVVMSNHVHLLIRTKQMPLEDIMRDLKSYTSREILKSIKENPQESRHEWMLWIACPDNSGFERAGKKNPNNKTSQFWQQNNHPIELGHEPFDIQQSLDYIHNNPVVVGILSKAEEYNYSSAMDYAGEKGLVNVEML